MEASAGRVVQLYRVTASAVTAAALPELAPAAASVATPADAALLDATDSFGSSIAASDAFVAVGDPDAGSGLGQVTIYTVSTTDAGATEAMCAVPGTVASGGVGYSVTVVAAAAEGRGGDSGRQQINTGTALVVAGSPGANFVAVIRVNATAFAEGASGSAVCQIVALVRQSARFVGTAGGAVPPLYGAGTAVALGGGMLAFSSPFARTWPTQGTAEAAANSMAGTGRVFGASFCWAGDVPRASVAAQANVPSVCTPCAGSGSGDWSLGGGSLVCETCADRVCRSMDDHHYFTAVNNSAPLENGERYELDVTAISRSGRSNTATSLPFMVDWTPPVTGFVFDAYVGNASRCTYCHDDLDVNTNATYLSVSWCCGWHDHESGIKEYYVGYSTAPVTADVGGGSLDILNWTNAGLGGTHVLPDVELVSGQRYYSCVVAVNNAGLFSDVICTNGVVYDMTPPQMIRVDDGLVAGKDVDAQTFLNLAFTTYLGDDNETAITDYLFSLGSQPGLTDILAEETGGDSLLNGVVGRPFDSEVTDGQLLYVNVRAVNEVGLSSDIMSSDGVRIGTAELDVSPATGGTMALNAQQAVESTEDEPDNGVPTELNEEPKQTVAMVDFPPGAVGGDQQFTGGAIDPQDIANGDAVNATETPPPAQNFKFGDHSFTLKAQDKSGQVQEGYVFEKPIVISMIYSVGDALKGEAAPAEWEPKLTIYDKATGGWINARDTCPLEKQWEETIHSLRQYSVRVCHLTQFALFYQLRPVAVLAPIDSALKMYTVNTSAALTRLTDIDPNVEGGVGAIFMPLTRDPATGVLSGGVVNLDASDSYDPDGTIASFQWTLRHANSSVHASYPQPIPIPATLSSTNTATTTVTAVASGVAQATLVVTDESGGTRSHDVWFWMDEPPVAAIGDGLGTQPAPRANGVWPTVYLTAAVEDTSFAVRLDGSASWDREASPLQATWRVVPGSVAMRAGGDLISTPAIGSPAATPTLGIASGLLGGMRATFELTVTSLDLAAASDVATVEVVVNAAPHLVVDAPEAVFLPLSSATVSIAASSDIDGSIVRRSWTYTPVRPAGIGATTTVTPLGSGEVESVTVSGVTGFAEFLFGIEIEDNEGAITARNVTVVFKNPGAAVITPVGPLSALTSPPAWNTMTRVGFDGSASFDSDGAITGWHWAIVAANVRAGGPVGAAAADAGIEDRDSVTAYLVGGYTAGEYTLRLAVDATNAVTLSSTTQVRVLMVIDVAEASAAGEVVLVSPATEATLTAAPALHADASVVKYEWAVEDVAALNNPGCTVPLTVTSSTTDAATVASTCGPGRYTVRSTVTIADSANGGAEYTESGTVVVVVRAPPGPVITLSATPAAGGSGVAVADYATVKGRAIAVSALDSTVGSTSTIVAYQWTVSPALMTFDDATAAETYVRAVTGGVCTITLALTDSHGETRSVTTTVWVMPAPVAAFIAPETTRIASRSPREGGVEVSLDAGASTFADGALDESGFVWSVTGTTANMTLAEVEAAYLPTRTGRVVHFVGDPMPFDYEVTVAVTSPAGDVTTTATTLTVLGRATVDVPRVARLGTNASIDVSLPAVDLHANAGGASIAWSVVGYEPLDSTTQQPCAGAGVAPATTAWPMASAPTVTAACGSGNYLVDAMVSLLDSSNAVAATTTLRQTVHVHEPPTAAVALSASSPASAFGGPAAGTFVSWIGQPQELRLSASGSTDDEGVVTTRWAISEEVAAPMVGATTASATPTSDGTPAPAGSVATVRSVSSLEAVVVPEGVGMARIAAAVVDTEGATTTTHVEVHVFSSEEDAANFAAGRVYVPDDSLSSGTMAAMIAAGALAVIAAAVALFYWRQSQAARDRRVSKLHMDKPPPATPLAAVDLTHPLDVEGRQAAERRAGKLPPLQHRPPPTQPQPAADSLVAPTPWVQTGAGSGAGGGAAAQSDPVAALFGSVSGGGGSRDGDGNRTDGRSTFSTPTNAVQ